MAEYGSRLPKDLQYAGEAPFEDQFLTHRLLLDATLGRHVEDALAYFAGRASAAAAPGDQTGAPQSTTAVETYLILLQRTGRHAEALTAYAELVPKGCELSPHAPTLMELAAASGDWDRYEAICREREDLIGYAAGVLARAGGGRAVEIEM
jgi:hypothetical protein